MRLLTCRLRSREGLRGGRTASAASVIDFCSELSDFSGSLVLQELISNFACTLLSNADLRDVSDLSLLKSLIGERQLLFRIRSFSTQNTKPWS